MSIEMKADQLTWGYLSFTSYGTKVITGYFDLANGLVGTLGADVDDAYMEYLHDGWYRVGLGFTADGTDTAADFNVYLADADGDISVDRDGTSSILVSKAQLEESAAFPSSYVPTTTAAVTRNKEQDEYAGAGNTAYPCTIIADYTPSQVNQVDQAIVSLHDGDANEERLMWVDGLKAENKIVSDGTTRAEVESTESLIPGVTYSIACVMQENNAVLYVDGKVTGTIDTSVTPNPDAATVLAIGMDYNAANQGHGHTNNVRTFPKVLNATEIKRQALN